MVEVFIIKIRLHASQTMGNNGIAILASYRPATAEK